LTVFSIFSCVSIYRNDQYTDRYVHNVRTDLEDIAQNTYVSKGLRYLGGIIRTLCDTAPNWTIVQVFDFSSCRLMALKSGDGGQSDQYRHSECTTHSQNDSIL
jgi:hypothetical protein